MPPAMPEPPGPLTIGASLAVGTVALLMLGLQPLLLGALADEHRLTVDQIGYAATAELLALGLTTGLLAGILPPARIRLINAVGCVAFVAANVASLYTQGIGLVASRGAAGVAGGLLVWIAIAVITRAARPDRISGIFLIVQALAQGALAAILPVTLMPRYGANGGLASLAVFGVLAIAGSFVLPGSLARLPKPASGGAALPASGLVGLASVFLYLAGIVGLWVFVEQIGTGARIDATLVGFAVAASLGAQIAGGLLATFATGRVGAVPVLAVCCVLAVGLTFVLGGSLSAPTYLACVMLLGLLWMLAMPFQTRMLIDLDPTRRSAMFLSAVQLSGSAAGPLVTSAFATQTSLAGALHADLALFAACGVVTVALAVWRRA